MKNYEDPYKKEKNPNYDKPLLDDGEEDRLIERIFEGAVTIYSLPRMLYFKTADRLIEGLNSGFLDKANTFKYIDLYDEMKTNLYIFSGAKTYTQVSEINSLLRDGKSIRPFSEFKKLAKETLTEYNENYLKTEYNTAIGRAQTAVKWQQIEREQHIFPYVVRRAVEDQRICETCSKLNGLVAPVSSRFWDLRSPPTHFGCRCILEQLGHEEGAKLMASDEEIQNALNATEHINPLFKNNPCKTKEVFDSSHPYFDVPKKDRQFAKTDFGLPIP